MPPSIDADASPNHPPSPLACSGHVEPTRTALTASNGDENEPNFDAITAPDPTSLAESIEFVSREVFATPKLRSMQSWAIDLCLEPTKVDSKLLFVTRTGYGKSHVMRTLGVLVGGVVVILVPLLSLSADQMNKMKEASQKYGTVETHHLDEFPTDDGGLKLRTLVDRINALEETTTSTIFLFTSPQFLCEQSNEDLLNALIKARARHVLRVVGIDEAHLFTEHAAFRVEILMLTELFFKKIFDNDTETHPILLAMTATLPLQYIRHLEALTNVSFDKCRLLRPKPKHFMQLNVHMQYSVDTVTYSNALNPLVTVIENSTTDSVVVFTTLPSTADSMEAKLCEKLNKAECNVDVVKVTGRLTKTEKFFNMRLFSAKMEYVFFRPRALICNSAGNTGIDSPTVKAMVRAGFGMNLTAVFQERGRCARGEHMTGSINYVCTIKSLLENLHLLNELGPRDESNSANKDNARKKTGIYKSLEAACKRKMKGKKKKLIEEKNTMQLEVLKFFCLSGGCYHIKSAFYLSSGEFVPLGDNEKALSCNGRCSVCDGSWSSLHLPVVKTEVISWLQSFEYVEPTKATDDPHSLTNLLWNDKKGWKEKIFGRNKAIKKYHVECLMLSLIAAEIIIWRVVNGKIEWWRNRVSGNDGNTYCYMISNYWEGIPLK